MNEKPRISKLGSSLEFHSDGVQEILEKWNKSLSAVEVLTAFVAISAFAFVGKKDRPKGWLEQAGSKFLSIYAAHPLFTAELLAAIERERSRPIPRRVKEMAVHFSTVIDSAYHRNPANKATPGRFLSYDQLADILKRGLESRATGENIRQAFNREKKRRDAIDERWSARLVACDKKPIKVSR